jgi:hypothetical protein
MILFTLGYGSQEMAMLKVNSKRRYPEAYEAFKQELQDSITTANIRSGFE